MTIYLAGGGSHSQEALVWREAFSGITRAVYWPFALPDDRIPHDVTSWLHAALHDLDIGVNIDVWPSLDGRSSADLRPYELLFVGGGTTSKLAAHVHAYGFTQPVIDFVTGGGGYLGSSAGAILACDTITIAGLIEDDPDARGMAGLGLVPGLSVYPHADTFSADPVQLARELGHDVIALPEASGVAIRDGELRAIGPDTVRLIADAGATERIL
ncbi:MAG: Type 1 glutamine amidotransferase-like domain-containing protein [Micromonosporaceae bacterium]|nr:Type 1 glutamine amidotransferase-like domain-containing protein [Micromonosporaceae bacterium]